MHRTSMGRASDISAGVCNTSILLYTVWLLLPAAQTTGRAVTGAVAVGLFVLGVLLDRDYLRTEGLLFLLRMMIVAALPLILWHFLRRGGENFWGYYVQQAMFWYPLLYCSYARQRQDFRLWRCVKVVLIAVLAITTLTTIGWLVEGMLRGDRVYAYSRSLGSGEPGREDYLKELMLRNIGGYDFVYASVLTLPFTCYGIQKNNGWKRMGWVLFCMAQVGMIGLSQYTYAMLFAILVMLVQGVAVLIRVLYKRCCRKNMGVGNSLLWTLPFLLGLCFAGIPLLDGASRLSEIIGFSNFAFSLDQLKRLLQGDVLSVASRMDYYRLPLQGIAESPFVGILFSGKQALLSQHSDLLDLLSAGGILGAGMFFFAVWLVGKGVLRGAASSDARAQFMLQYTLVLICALVGTVTYSRDIPLVLCLSALLVLEHGEANLFVNEPAEPLQP